MNAMRLLFAAPGLRRAAPVLLICLATLIPTKQSAAAQGVGDLVVESVVGPSAADEATAIQVSWTVRNTGKATISGAWSDKVLLSEDSTIGGDVFLEGFAFAGALSPGESYVRTKVLLLPQGIAGSQWVVVETDAGDQVPEIDESNNAAAGANPIDITPLYPDLVVTDIEVSATSFNTWDESITVTWTVENQGTSPAIRDRYDRITFSSDDVPGGDSNTNYELYVSLSGDPQLPGESRTYSREIRPYSTIGGEGYLGILVDRSGSENEGPDGESNSFIDDTLVTVGTPDLVVTNVTVTPDPLSPGGLATIS